MSKIIIDIDGMSCGHCTAAVERALSAVPGVSAVRVTLKPGQAEVEGEGEGEGLDEQALREAVTEEGYEVTGMHSA